MGCFPSNRKRTDSPPEALEPEANVVIQELPQRLVVTTRFDMQDIACLDRTPDSTSRQVVRYTCPVCLRFLSTILVSSCCHNYLCHFCLDAMDQTSQQLRCPMCTAEPLVLTDVEVNAPIKKYSDSPYSTVGAGKSSRAQGQKWLAPMEIVEEDMKLGLEGQEDDQPSFPQSDRPLTQELLPRYPCMTH